MVVSEVKVWPGSSEDAAVAVLDLRVLAGVLTFTVATAGEARADEGVVLRGDRLDAAWARALDAIARVVADRADVDATVELTIAPDRDGGVRVVARRPSGEVAVRRVDEIEDLEPTILALIVVPVRRVAAPAAEVAAEVPVSPPASPPPASPPPPPPTLARELTPLSTVAAATAASTRPRFQVGAAVGVRWQGALAVGGNAFVDAGVGRWLVGATAGWSTSEHGQSASAPAGTESVPVHYSMNTFELGVDVGRQFAVGPVEMAALVGPRFAASTRSLESHVDRTDMALREPPVLTPGLREARVAGGVRARLAGSSRVRMMMRLEASLDLTESGGDTGFVPRDGDPMLVVGGPDVPAWGIALTFGGQFGVGR
jgi:hypothetical protein